jgi:hypothetical protein
MSTIRQPDLQIIVAKMSQKVDQFLSIPAQWMRVK